MNGNPVYHWIGLAIATAVMVPMPAAMLRGWVPPWQRKKYAAGVRLRAWALLCLYGNILANGIPRLADASYRTVTACMSVGFGCIAAAAVLFFLADRRDNRATKAGCSWSRHEPAIDPGIDRHPSAAVPQVPIHTEDRSRKC